MISNAQRALWTFLIYALVAPFFAALAARLLVALAWAFNLTSLLPVEVTSLGEVGLAVFVWSIVPAVLTGSPSPASCGAPAASTGCSPSSSPSLPSPSPRWCYHSTSTTHAPTSPFSPASLP